MKRQLSGKLISMLAVAVLLNLSSAALAQNNNASGPIAQGKTGSNPASKLATLELSMKQSAGKDTKAYVRAQGEYWGIIHEQNDFGRAYEFFNQLATTNPSSPDVLGSQGSAIGSYIGWLYSSGAIKQVDEQFVTTLDGKAHAAFEKALQIDPNNFTALLGYAIYESYNPTGAEHSKELFARLEGLRSSHPEYSWQVVDELKKESSAKK